MRHFSTGPLSRPALGHPIGVAATAMTGLLEASPRLPNLPPARLRGAFWGAVPISSVTNPAEQEVLPAQGALTESEIRRVQVTAYAAVDLQAGSCEITYRGGSILLWSIRSTARSLTSGPSSFGRPSSPSYRGHPGSFQRSCPGCRPASEGGGSRLADPAQAPRPPQRPAGSVDQHH